MIIDNSSNKKRSLRKINIKTDFVIVGGGLSGVCGAITAARGGIKVTLIQDRPVLGGNASSEVRLWVLGATSHMGNNNRWAREGGVIDEILVENTYRNPEGNPIIFDALLLDKVISEPNITLLLNTSVYDIEKSDGDTITSVSAFCSQNQTEYCIEAPFFCDASGDGIIAFLSGAAFRMGAESKEEFGEKFAPNKEYGELLGHSLYFYSKETSKPVKFVAPTFAIDVTKEIPKFRSFNAKDFGCRLWWIEYGGRLDTVFDTEIIKHELWKVVYGVWDYIKNSGSFPEAENLTLEWVGMIPGKRESRRFEGDYMMTQQDIIEQRRQPDAVAFGGWSVDLHPSDGVFSEIGQSSCNQWHSKGIYEIPYRSLYSKNINNLFLAGRIISASHVAFASTRVMATSAYTGQAVAVAAILAIKNHVSPREIFEKGYISELQNELIKSGQYIPNVILKDELDVVQSAKLSASSELQLDGFTENGHLETLDVSVGQVLPLQSTSISEIYINAYAEEVTTLEFELRSSSKIGNFTPDNLISKKSIALKKGDNSVIINLEDVEIEKISQYGFLCFMKNELVKLPRSNQRISGILSVFNTVNPAVSNYGKQMPTEDIGVEEFEFWTARRRPQGHNLALKFKNSLQCFEVNNLKNGIARPSNQPNAWVADFKDENPIISLEWSEKQEISRIELSFDTDFDHPMESVLMTHPESVMPFCIRNYKIFDENEALLFEKIDNFQTRNTIKFEKPIVTQKLKIQFSRPGKDIPAALFEIRCYK